jgi:hypothetical protein
MRLHFPRRPPPSSPEWSREPLPRRPLLPPVWDARVSLPQTALRRSTAFQPPRLRRACLLARGRIAAEGGYTKDYGSGGDARPGGRHRAVNPWCARHRPGRCPGLTNGRPVGAAVGCRLEFFGISPERAVNHQPRATHSATRVPQEPPPAARPTGALPASRFPPLRARAAPRGSVRSFPERLVAPRGRGRPSAPRP